MYLGPAKKRFRPGPAKRYPPGARGSGAEHNYGASNQAVAELLYHDTVRGASRNITPRNITFLELVLVVVVLAIYMALGVAFFGE